MIQVLLVDDNPALFNITKLLLEKDGKILVDICNSVRQARENLEQKRYHVIVSDYDMPGENGITFLRSLRESGHSIPFILFTGKGNERVAMDACNGGADYYMTKSGPAQDVFRTLRERVVKAAERSGSAYLPKERDAMGSLILESMSDLVLVLDRQQEILIANPSAKRAFRGSPDDPSSLPVQQFLTRESSARLECALNILKEDPTRDPRPGNAEHPLTLEVIGDSEVAAYQAVIDLLSGPPGAEILFLLVGRRAGP